jgi:manganese/iron transport system permease protein
MTALFLAAFVLAPEARGPGGAGAEAREWVTLLLPFQLPFMQAAFAVAVLTAVPMAMLSCFLVLRGWALMGDAISHAVLPGVILSYLAGLPIAVGAFAAGFLCAAATGWLRDQSRIKEDTAMGVVFSGLFGLGLVLYASVPTTLHLSHLLFGDMLGVTWGDVGWAGLAGAVVVAALLVWRADLVAQIFDAGHARAIGLPVRALHYGLLRWWRWRWWEPCRRWESSWQWRF